jgi:hypothetical protein
MWEKQTREKMIHVTAGAGPFLGGLSARQSVFFLVEMIRVVKS